MTLVTSVVILAVGAWFHRRRDRPVLAGNIRRIFTRPRAIAYLLVVALMWLISVTGTVAQLTTGWPGPTPQNPAVVVLALVLAAAAVYVVLSTAHAIDSYDDEARGPIGQLGRFVRVGYGTSAHAALRFLRGQPYP